jgi:hypothetical protein
MLRLNMIIQILLNSSLEITRLALMLEITTMLCTNMHVNGALVGLGKIAVGALEISVLSALVLELNHGDCF